MGWKLEAVSIPASDVDRAKTFYAEKVRFNVDLDVNADGDPRVRGVGGSHAYDDTKTGTTFALTKNRLTPSFETAEQVAGIVAKAVAGG